MAKPLMLQQRFGLGMKPDYPVEDLPTGAVLLMQNMIPGFEGGCAARDGWARVGATLGDTYAAALAFAPFTAAVQLVGITDQGAVKQVPHTGVAAITARGTAQLPAQQPVFYRQKLYITNSDGTTSLKSYDGSSNAAAAAGSPPAAMYACIYKDHLVVARTAANPNRVWFSNGGDAGAWDTAADGQWVDTSYPITGLATLRNMILVFSEEGVERIRGDIIPGVAGSDMVLEPLFATGCADAFSVSVADDFAIYANSSGVFLTDGIAVVDLTEQGGVAHYWGKTAWPYSSSFNLAGGIAGGKYVVAVHNGSEFIRCMVCDIPKRIWYEFTNIPAWMFATAPTGLASVTAGDLFFAERDAPWLVNASTLFHPRSTTGLATFQGLDDANGTDTTLTVRTGFFTGTPDLKRIRNVYVTAHHEASHTGTMYAYPDALMDPDDRFSIGTLPASSHPILRKPFPVNKRGYGIGVEYSIAKTSGTGEMRLDKIEVEMRPLEGSR